MKVTRREKFLLRKALDFPVHRYILSKRRMNGMEKAEMHIEISKIIFEFANVRGYKPEDWDDVIVIHDKLTVITDNLDQFGYNVDTLEEVFIRVVDNVLAAIIEFIESRNLKVKR